MPSCNTGENLFMFFRISSYQQISFLGAIVLAAVASTAGAQSPGQPGRVAADNAGGLEEIVVTARKVEEKLQDIPLTVSAFSEEALKNYNVLRVGDLNALTPGLNYQEGSGRGGAGRFFIRGLTGGVAGTARASTFIDGVYVANSVGNILFGEMERAEVLLGPQSAQFGRATFGGALNLITKSPNKETWGGSAALSIGSDGERNFDGFVGGPIVEGKLLGSIYVGTQKYGGPGKWRNPPDVLHPNGVHLGGTETNAGTVKLIYTPIEKLRIVGRFSYNKDHDEPAFSNIILPQYRTAVYQQVRSTCSGTVALNNITCTQGPPQPAYYFSGTLKVGDSFRGGFPVGVRNFDLYADPDYRNHTQRATIAAAYALPAENTLRLTWSDNKETQDFGNFTDSDFTAFPSSRFSPSYQTIRDKSVELRLDSAKENRFRYSVGAYYLSLKTNLDALAYADFFCNTVCVPTSPAAIFQPTLIGTTLTGWTGSVGGGVSRFGGSPFVTRNSVRDASAFLGLFYDFTDRWTASFEGRWQTETIGNFNISSQYNGGAAAILAGTPIGTLVSTPNPLVPIIGGQLKFTSFLPRVNVQWKITPVAQLYATYSKGNNPGGINTATQIGQAGSPVSEAQRPIKEEKLTNIELGFKSTWLDNRLRLNGSIYQMKWDDLQNSGTYFLNGVFFGVTENRGAATIKGLGIDAEFAPTSHWTMRGQVSYNKGTYDKFCSIQLANLLYGPALGAPYTLLGADPRCLAAGSNGQFNTRAQLVSGNELETAPKKTASIGLEYHTTIMGDWTLAPRGNVQYSDGQWESEMNLAKSPNWFMLELGVGLERGPQSFEVFCRNCNDEDAPQRTTRLTDPYASNAPVALGGLGYNQTIGNNPRRPRQYGARFAYKF